jgi:hypothetical protein
VHHPGQDPQGLVEERPVAGRGGGGEERLHRVHVGVDAAVLVELLERLVPLLDDHPVLVVPEPPEQHVEGVGEQLLGPRPTGAGGGGGGEHDERVLVGGLVTGGGLTRGAQAGVPAAVARVAEPPGECPQAVVGRGAAAGTSHQVPEGEHVRHPAGDPQLDRSVQLWTAGHVEPGEPTGRMPGGPAEVEQPIPLRLEPAGVRR